MEATGQESLWIQIHTDQPSRAEKCGDWIWGGKWNSTALEGNLFSPATGLDLVQLFDKYKGNSPNEKQKVAGEILGARRSYNIVQGLIVLI